MYYPYTMLHFRGLLSHGGSADIATNAGEIGIQPFLVTLVDDVYQFLELGTYLLHMVLSVRVEQDFPQQRVVL